jgi:hypothetical protein
MLSLQVVCNRCARQEAAETPIRPDASVMERQGVVPRKKVKVLS